MDIMLRAALLANAARVPLDTFLRLREVHGPDGLWNEALWPELGFRPSAQRRLGELLRERDWPERELERAERAGARFLTVDDPAYPPRLRDLDQPPIGLYVRGHAELLSDAAVAVVGTRRCTAYGKSVAERVGKALARAGLLLVSGGARGIDAAGHHGCLAEGGVTVAVLGTGVERVYPLEHRELFDRILEAGALVSEYPMGTSGEPWRFPERNRLIVGMTGRAVVVESPEDGGAMITARLALDIGREVWAVPGRILEATCRGSNQLLRDGAQALVDLDEFVQCISGRYGQLMLELDAAPMRPLPALTADERVVLKLLQARGSLTMDELLGGSGLDFVVLQTCLLSLTSNNLVLENLGRYAASE